MLKTNSKKINIGVVGLGFGGRVHIPAFMAVPECSIKAVASKAAEEVDEISKKYGIKETFLNWEDMLDSADIDAVTIATPPNTQPEIALKALDKGKAVFCEKPVSLDMPSARKMTEKAAASGLPNMIDFEFPEIPQWTKARELIERGEIGRISHVSVSWHLLIYPNKIGIDDSWKTKAKEGGGALNLFTSHVLYYLEWLAGPISEISARLTRAPYDTRNADTSNDISAVFSSGASGTISVITDAPGGHGHSVRIYGEKGSLIIDNVSQNYASGYKLYLASRGKGTLDAVDISPEKERISDNSLDSRVKPVSKIAERFIEWIRTGKPARPDLSDGLRVQEFLEMCRRSDAEGKRIRS